MNGAIWEHPSWKSDTSMKFRFLWLQILALLAIIPWYIAEFFSRRGRNWAILFSAWISCKMFRKIIWVYPADAEEHEESIQLIKSDMVRRFNP